MNIDNRLAMLAAMGLGWDEKEQAYTKGDVYIPMVDIKSTDDGSWDELVNDICEHMGIVVPEIKPLPLATISEEEVNEEDTDVMLVRTGISLFQSVPAILTKSKTRLSKASLAVKAFREKNKAGLDEKSDIAANDLIVRVNKMVKEMNIERSEFTQITGSITKMFTALEKEGKELAESIQPLRDDWARKVIAEQKRREKEAAEKAAIETAKAALEGHCVTAIGTILTNFIFERKTKWNEAFNAITLENYEDKKAKLTALKIEIKKADVLPKLVYDLPYTPKLDEEARMAVQAKVHAEYDFDGWISKAVLELTEYKDGLVDRLPTKKEELEEAAEKARIEAEKEAAAKKAALEAQEAAKKASEANRKQLEENARIAAENAIYVEENRKAQAAADEKAKKDAEDAEKARLDAEKKAAEDKAKQEGELREASANAQALFDQSIEASPDVVTPENRQGYNIVVLHQAGWVEIFQLWYGNEGAKLGIEDMGKKSLGQMKTWAEGHAMKNGEKITSKHLRYEDKIKAVNRKS